MSDEQTQTINQQTETSTAQAPSAPAPEATVTAPVGGDAQQGLQTEKPTWVPNYKYKVNGVEKDFDPMFRDIVKDADTEKKIKDILERAEGTDIFRSKLGEFDRKHKDIETKLNDQTNKLQHAAMLWEQDKDQFFEYMGMDVNDIYKWVAEKLRLEQAPETEKQLYNSEREARRMAMEREQEIEFYRQRAAQEAVQAKSFQLQQELAKVEVAPLISQYDSVYGQGAFETAVKQLGKITWDTQKVDLSAADAVGQVANYFKSMVDKFGGTQSASQGQTKEPPVIPTIKAGASSPAKRAVKSLDDIKKLAAQFQ